jgi:hypothetical protein
MSDIERVDATVARVALLGVAATRERERAALAAVAPFTLMARAGDAVARLAIALVRCTAHRLAGWQQSLLPVH